MTFKNNVCFVYYYLMSLEISIVNLYIFFFNIKKTLSKQGHCFEYCLFTICLNFMSRPRKFKTYTYLGFSQISEIKRKKKKLQKQ